MKEKRDNVRILGGEVVTLGASSLSGKGDVYAKKYQLQDCIFMKLCGGEFQKIKGEVLNPSSASHLKCSE